ncbi:hypothetical protein BKA83DRAFT_213545 [Pisolithus microcarpus]|nr:hypothetical protein BKA83DRAFT_213545 [Pisolithus microcarpus]
MIVDGSTSKPHLRSLAKPPNKMVQEGPSATSHDSEPAELMDSERGDSTRTVYPVDEERTPRPSRRNESAAVPTMPTDSNSRSSAVQLLNRRAGATKGDTSDQWCPNLRTTAPDDSDDCSEASRTGRNLRRAVRSRKDIASERRIGCLRGHHLASLETTKLNGASRNDVGVCIPALNFNRRRGNSKRLGHLCKDSHSMCT